MAISIHVPSWGTTPGLCLSHTILKISIHVPSWGTTNLIAIPERFPAFQSTFPRGERLKAQYGVGLSIAYFNPRSLVGNDKAALDDVKFSSISIHVPSWGTTGVNQVIKQTVQFQSTFPRGERRRATLHGL